MGIQENKIVLLCKIWVTLCENMSSGICGQQRSRWGGGGGGGGGRGGEGGEAGSNLVKLFLLFFCKSLFSQRKVFNPFMPNVP